jgi:beta-glucanase (GH16 family)
LPDSTKWGYEVGKIRNAELQYYTSKRLENARIEDSVLIIEARKEKYSGADYTSASILSKGIGDWKYGKIEISAKVPAGKGTWPALWMMPTYSEYGGWPRSGEIDIMEYIGVEPQKLHYTCHFEGTNGSGHQSSGTGSTFIVNPFNQFIKYEMIWTPDKIEWYANDKKFHEYRKQQTFDNRSWPFDKEFYLILNLAYGGSWGGYAGVDDTKLPHKFLIDYVRVYQLQDT